MRHWPRVARQARGSLAFCFAPFTPSHRIHSFFTTDSLFLGHWIHSFLDTKIHSFARRICHSLFLGHRIHSFLDPRIYSFAGAQDSLCKRVNPGALIHKFFTDSGGYVFGIHSFITTDSQIRVTGETQILHRNNSCNPGQRLPGFRVLRLELLNNTPGPSSGTGQVLKFSTLRLRRTA